TDPAKVIPGSIRGTVVEGALSQSGLDVILKDEKGAEKDRAKTRDDGSFEFAKVLPGKDTVSCTKTATNRIGQGKVEGVAEHQAAVTIKLYRAPRPVR